MNRPPPGSGPALGAAPDRRLIVSLGLNLVITLLQVVGGIVANSLGLLSDAAHNLSDVVALGLSLWAVRLGRRGATPRRTFAYKRAEILVAMFNSAVLVAISVYIIVEAVRRLLDPQPVEGLWVIIFAGGGLVINGIAALLLRSHGHDLNLRSAFLHLVGDAVTSLGVMLSGVVLYFRDWNYADAIVSILVSLWIGREAVRHRPQHRQRAHGGYARRAGVRRGGAGRARHTRSAWHTRPSHLVDLVQRPGPFGPRRGRRRLGGLRGRRDRGRCQSDAGRHLRRGPRHSRAGDRRRGVRRQQLRVTAGGFAGERIARRAPTLAYGGGAGRRQRDVPLESGRDAGERA